MYQVHLAAIDVWISHQFKKYLQGRVQDCVVFLLCCSSKMKAMIILTRCMKGESILMGIFHGSV